MDGLQIACGSVPAVGFTLNVTSQVYQSESGASELHSGPFNLEEEVQSITRSSTWYTYLYRGYAYRLFPPHGTPAPCRGHFSTACSLDIPQG